MTVDWSTVQKRLGVKADGRPGPITYTALLTKIAGHETPLLPAMAAGFAEHIPAYKVDDNPERLAQFLGQCAHESGSFFYQREAWGPTRIQRAYDAPGNHLGNHAGDGFTFRGAGPIEVTGRYWIDLIGHNVGLDLAGNPKMLDDPAIGVLVTLEWWRINGINAIADLGDAQTVTRKVNPALLGLAQRVAYVNVARSILS